eukprot:CAMPEP_0114365432 /NCGR_PEP_ID=MMETSP0101-20121206/28409_1 /TAXON_ID=38822 ORGANISM="Pteridomonas danica, Strain PT" /NCGR_SAMPLE_ID=MMETSP0101 /ASSEMBLY_ACC=CAM_ASM_000211 /LENGTH=1089 /DNA_ID=CAMNT_0001513765 /DNA_START=106 /DNA_END=3371 /DNA_ORIENTATION=+
MKVQHLLAKRAEMMKLMVLVNILSLSSDNPFDLFKVQEGCQIQDEQLIEFEQAYALFNSKAFQEVEGIFKSRKKVKYSTRVFDYVHVKGERKNNINSNMHILEPSAPNMTRKRNRDDASIDDSDDERGAEENEDIPIFALIVELCEQFSSLQNLSPHLLKHCKSPRDIYLRFIKNCTHCRQSDLRRKQSNCNVFKFKVLQGDSALSLECLSTQCDTILQIPKVYEYCNITNTAIEDYIFLLSYLTSKEMKADPRFIHEVSKQHSLINGCVEFHDVTHQERSFNQRHDLFDNFLTEYNLVKNKPYLRLKSTMSECTKVLTKMVDSSRRSSVVRLCGSRHKYRIGRFGTNEKNVPAVSQKSREDCFGVLTAISQDGLALRDASDELRNDFHVVLPAVIKNGLALKYVSDELRNDSNVVTAAVSNNIMALEYVSDNVVIDAVSILKRLALRYRNEGLCNNNDKIVCKAVQHNGMILQYASNWLRNDYNVVLAAVTNNGLALQYASYELRNDYNIVLAAVTNHGLALKYASDELRNDYNVVVAAVSSNIMALQYVSDEQIFELQNDQVMSGAVSNVGMANLVLQYTNDGLRNNDKIVRLAVPHNGMVLQYASAGLQNDYNVVLAAVSNHGLALQYASAELRNSDKIVLAAVSRNGAITDFVFDNLIDQHGLGIVLATVSKKLLVLTNAGFVEPRNFFINAVSQNGDFLSLLSTAYMSYKLEYNIVLSAVTNYGFALRHASDELRKNRTIVNAAINDHWRSADWASEDLIADPEFQLELVACGGREAANVYFKSPTLLSQFDSHLSKLMKLYTISSDIFLSTILFAVSPSYPPTNHQFLSTCPLRKLHKLGTYHSSIICRLIAEYSGVQTGPRYNTIRRASMKWIPFDYIHTGDYDEPNYEEADFECDHYTKLNEDEIDIETNDEDGDVFEHIRQKFHNLRESKSNNNIKFIKSLLEKVSDNLNEVRFQRLRLVKDKIVRIWNHRETRHLMKAIGYQEQEQTSEHGHRLRLLHPNYISFTLELVNRYCGVETDVNRQTINGACNEIDEWELNEDDLYIDTEDKDVMVEFDDKIEPNNAEVFERIRNSFHNLRKA